MGVPGATPAVPVDPGGAPAHQDFSLLRDRAFDLPDFEHVGRTVSVTNQRFHVR